VTLDLPTAGLDMITQVSVRWAAGLVVMTGLTVDFGLVGILAAPLVIFTTFNFKH